MPPKQPQEQEILVSEMIRCDERGRIVLPMTIKNSYGEKVPQEFFAELRANGQLILTPIAERKMTLTDGRTI